MLSKLFKFVKCLVLGNIILLAGCAQTISMRNAGNNEADEQHRGEFLRKIGSSQASVLFVYDAQKNEITPLKISRASISDNVVGEYYDKNSQMYEQEKKIIDCVILTKSSYSACLYNTSKDRLSLFNKNAFNFSKGIGATIALPFDVMLTLLGSPSLSYTQAVEIESDHDAINLAGDRINRILSKQVLAVEPVYEQLSGREIYKSAADLPVAPEQLPSYLDPARVSKSIDSIPDKRHWLTAANFADMSSLKKDYGIGKKLQEKYLKLDYKEAFDRAKSREELSSFIRTYKGFYDPENLAGSAYDKIVKLWRNENSFKGYFEAYKLTNSKDDFQSMNRIAKTPEEQCQMEALAVSLTATKSRFFDVSFRFDNTTSQIQSKSPGWLSFKSNIDVAVKTFSGVVSVVPAKNGPFQLMHGPYKVKLRLTLQAPLKAQMWSNALGNKSWTETQSASKDVVFDLDRSGRASGKISFGNLNIAYLDLGSSGGRTAMLMNENPVVRVEVIDLFKDGAGQTTASGSAAKASGSSQSPPNDAGEPTPKKKKAVKVRPSN